MTINASTRTSSDTSSRGSSVRISTAFSGRPSARSASAKGATWLSSRPMSVGSSSPGERSISRETHEAPLPNAQEAAAQVVHGHLFCVDGATVDVDAALFDYAPGLAGRGGQADGREQTRQV